MPLPSSLKQLEVCAERHFFGHPGKLKLYHKGKSLITSDEQIRDVRPDDTIVVTWDGRPLDGNEVKGLLTAYQSHFPAREVKTPVVPKRTDPKNLRCPPPDGQERCSTYSSAFPSRPRAPVQHQTWEKSSPEPYVGLSHRPMHFTRDAPLAAEDQAAHAGPQTSYAEHFPDRSGPSSATRPARRWEHGQVKPASLQDQTTYGDMFTVRQESSAPGAGNPNLSQRAGYPHRIVEEGHSHLANTRRGWYYDDADQQQFADSTSYTSHFGRREPVASRKTLPAPRSGPHLKHTPCPLEDDTEHRNAFPSRAQDFGQARVQHGAQIWLEPEVDKVPQVLV